MSLKICILRGAAPLIFGGVLCACGCSAPPASGELLRLQGETQAASRAEEPKAREEPPRVFMTLPKPVPLKLLCAMLADMTDVKVSCDSVLDDSLLVVDYEGRPVQEVVRDLCEKTGATSEWTGQEACLLKWNREGRPPLEGTDLSAEDVLLKTVCETLSKPNRPVSCDRELENKTITLQLRNLPFAGVIRHVARQVEAKAFARNDGSIVVSHRPVSGTEVVPFAPPPILLPLEEKKAGRLKALLAQLGDERFEKREIAAREIRQLGPGALPQLRQARADKDPEVRERVGGLISALAEQVQGVFAAGAEAELRQSIYRVALVDGGPPKMVRYFRQRSDLNFVVAQDARNLLEESIPPAMSKSSYAVILDNVIEKLNLEREFLDGAVYIRATRGEGSGSSE